MDKETMNTQAESQFEGRSVQIQIQATGNVNEPFDPLPYLKRYIQVVENGGKTTMGMFFENPDVMVDVEYSWLLAKNQPKSLPVVEERQSPHS